MESRYWHRVGIGHSTAGTRSITTIQTHPTPQPTVIYQFRTKITTSQATQRSPSPTFSEYPFTTRYRLHPTEPLFFRQIEKSACQTGTKPLIPFLATTNGMWLSLVERCVRDAETACSNHAIPTRKYRDLEFSSKSLFFLFTFSVHISTRPTRLPPTVA